ncbi:MAG: uracil-DNA glycosylase [Methylococcales bacterium]|nr:uracil-DNA glycosylase [Methylococcales bacterium]
MEHSTRLQYLEAMGIDVWISKEQAFVNNAVQINEVPENITEEAGNWTDSWIDLQAEVSECQKCTLCNSRTQTVFGTGNINADWMLISEAPGEQEEQEGLPFVGQASLLLTEMIRAIGLTMDDVYITNIVKCRAESKRDPKMEEIAACHEYIQRQVALVKPKIILAVGRVAAQALLETKEPLADLRGVVHQLAGISLVVIYHPAYLLRSPLEKRKAWQDLQLAIKVYQEL